MRCPLARPRRADFPGGAIDIAPDSSSSEILNTGTSVDVDSAWTLEVDLTYMFSEHVGLELIAATANHDLSTTGGVLGGADAGSVWVLPPTLTLQYFFGTGNIRPYIGAGINYTVFYDTISPQIWRASGSPTSRFRTRSGSTATSASISGSAATGC